jgi:hypothetical protein
MGHQERRYCPFLYRLEGKRFLHVPVMKGQKGAEQNARIMIAFIYRQWRAMEREQGVNSGLRRADRIFHCEDDVVRQFAELPDEGEVS